MSNTVEKISGNKVKIRIEAEAPVFEDGVQKAYLKMRGRINVPGFRKGKAPRKLIENMYGVEVFYDDAINEVFPDLYEKAVEENELQPVGRPDVDIEQIGAGQSLILTAEVFVRPDVTLGEYKGVKVHKHDHPVTDDDVDRKLDQAREKVSRMVEVEDRPIQDDDIVNLDYAGSVDGVPFDGGTAQGQSLTIGSGQFIPGFEEQLVGLNVGEEKDITVTFPEEYHAEELKGKEAVFHVKINGIEVKELPELDDEFARDVSEFDTLEEYKADIRQKLEEDNQKHVDDAFENDVIEAAVENATVDIPDPMIERQIDNMINDFAMRLAYQGMRLEDFMQYTGQDMDSMRTQYREQAEGRVKAELVLEAIRKAEGIEATEEEVEKELETYAKQGEKTLEEFKKTLSERDMEYFQDTVALKKTVELLKDSAVVEAHDEHHAHEDAE